MAHPDLELRGKGGGGGGPVLIYLSCWPCSLQSFLLFLPKIREFEGGGGRGWAGAPPLDPPLEIDNITLKCNSRYIFKKWKTCTVFLSSFSINLLAFYHE